MRSILIALALRLIALPDGRLAEQPPLRCPRGHGLAKGSVLVGWLPCDCVPREKGPAGHRSYLCQVEDGDGPCGTEVFRPPCRRNPARAP